MVQALLGRRIAIRTMELWTTHQLVARYIVAINDDTNLELAT